MQSKGSRVLHIESRKSRQSEKEYEIFVSMEVDKRSCTEEVVASLKPRFCSVLTAGGKQAPAMKKTTSLDKGDTKCGLLTCIHILMMGHVSY